jgi:hypothetical protein
MSGVLWGLWIFFASAGIVFGICVGWFTNSGVAGVSSNSGHSRQKLWTLSQYFKICWAQKVDFFYVTYSFCCRRGSLTNPLPPCSSPVSKSFTLDHPTIHLCSCSCWHRHKLTLSVYKNFFSSPAGAADASLRSAGPIMLELAALCKWLNKFWTLNYR